MADQLIVANLTDIDRFIELLLLLSAEDTKGVSIGWEFVLANVAICGNHIREENG